MSGERIINALGLIDDEYIAEAAPEEKKRRRRIPWKWMSAAACIVLVASVIGALLWGRGPSSNAHMAILESGETVLFEKNPDPERSQSYIAVYSQTLSEEELRVLFGDLPISATAICREWDHKVLGYTGKIGDCILRIETEGLSLGGTIMEGSEGTSDINGVSVSAGYYLTDANSNGKGTIIYYARFTIGSVRYYLEQSGPYEDNESVRQNVAERARDLIVAFNVVDPYGGVSSERTKKFTEKEALINNAYHTLFPDRTDYIAFWTDEPDYTGEGVLFWAPESVVFPSGDYALYSSCRYNWTEFSDTYVFIFIDHARDTESKAMYVASFLKDGTIDAVLTVGTQQNRYKYYFVDGHYLAIESAYVHESDQSWNSLIIDLKEMEIVWSEDAWYDSQGMEESSTDLHKLLLSENGFTVYKRVMDSGKLSAIYEGAGFLSFDDLLYSERTKTFTEEQALINTAYHAMFPDRDSYIAYWEGSGPLHWIPKGLAEPFASGYSSSRYEWIELDGSYLFILIERDRNSIVTYEKNMYIAFVRPDGTISSVVHNISDTHFEYRVFTLDGRSYLAVETAYEHQGWGSWNSYIIDLNEEKIAWNERDWYEVEYETWPKMLISEDGFTVYEAKRANFSTTYEEVGFLSFAELLK